MISFIFLKHKPLSFSTFPLCVTFIRTFILTCIYNLFITKKYRTRRTSLFVHVPGPYFSFVACVENCQNGVRGDVSNFQNRYPLVPTRHQIFLVSEVAAGVILKIETNPRQMYRTIFRYFVIVWQRFDNKRLKNIIFMRLCILTPTLFFYQKWYFCSRCLTCIRSMIS